MLVFLRFMVMLFLVQTIAFVVISIWSRQTRRRKLEARWETNTLTGSREAFIRRGLERYDRSIRAKLIWGVYIVPIVVIGTIIYLVNMT